MKAIKITNPESPHCGRTGLGVRHNEMTMVYFDDAKGRNNFSIFDNIEVEFVGNATIYDATLLAYHFLSSDFHIMELVRSSRLIYEDENKMDGTITKRLRELRTDGKVNYEYNTTTKRYRKL